ncbi:LacI family DNA-binding transcriptional regulator [Paenibacillus woosongensis]|uniref:LacI family DNA-binding transcriptional regulator n=1 Tax=Paenibacillus woosongensis TaxID=307580 RepID=A0AA95L1Y2_9BACL|nr:LacI family DNA-binding transcriptional regulator [Paenibacillus woosongensis]WHX49481.1 LacI family DNA-binding transcriptional regulator [Paenibacillus woosongensis]
MKESKIIDVARRANVSPATVSRVLNGSNLVNAKTEERVLQAIRELDYIPNNMGKQLRSRKTMNLAVVVSDVRVSYYAEIIKGIENMANSLHYNVLICDAQNEKAKEREFLSLLMNRTVDALILVTPNLSDEEIAAYADNGYMVGLIGRKIEHARIPCSFTDNIKLAQEVVFHLAEQGHRKIAFLSGYADATDSIERFEGYVKALKTCGIPFEPALVENGDFSEEGGCEAFHRLCSSGADFTAVFAANDEMALGVYKACNELGISIPDQLAVAGVDNIRLTNYVKPRISSVEQPLYAMGAVLAEKLIDQMNDNVWAEKRCFKVDAKLVVKESSKGAE